MLALIRNTLTLVSLTRSATAVVLRAPVASLSTASSELPPAPIPPKRPATSYSLFVKEYASKRPTDLDPIDWFRQLPAIWNLLPEPEKTRFQAEGRRLGAEYKQIRAHYDATYTPAQRAASKYQKMGKAELKAKRELTKTNVDSDTAVSPAKELQNLRKGLLSSYNLFTRHAHVELKKDLAKGQKIDMPAASRQIAAAWKAMPAEAKQPFVDEAARIKAERARELGITEADFAPMKKKRDAALAEPAAVPPTAAAKARARPSVTAKVNMETVKKSAAAPSVAAAEDSYY
ncbi:hypothetical protein BC828DRAFT_371798 [Blastocladiella britannica]|nr:hypothetical protein BC828DRAFT_371798 [Blastocladiella britannica]